MCRVQEQQSSRKWHRVPRKLHRAPERGPLEPSNCTSHCFLENTYKLLALEKEAELDLAVCWRTYFRPVCSFGFVGLHDSTNEFPTTTKSNRWCNIASCPKISTLTEGFANDESYDERKSQRGLAIESIAKIHRLELRMTTVGAHSRNGELRKTSFVALPAIHCAT